MSPIRPRTLVREITEQPGLPPALRGEAAVAAVGELLRGGRVVAITGAGVSTDSGIPDYRGPTGRARQASPMSYQDFISGQQMQRRYWARSFTGWPVMGLARPNGGHEALVRLQRRGQLSGVITQNVDRLHARAGTDPLVELHGSLDWVVCLNCGKRGDRERFQARLREANDDLDPQLSRLGDDSGEIKPDGDIEVVQAAIDRFQVISCEHCGDGPVKPDVVFFGESVPRDRIAVASEWVRDASGVLVLGSSLAVMSSYQFVRQAIRQGLPVGIINQGPTRGDADATFRANAPVTHLLSQVLATDPP